MKKIQYAFMLVLGMSIFATSCEEKLNEVTTDETPVVSIALSYSLNTTNGYDMSGTKATNAEIFQSFYEKMANGSLTAPSYELRFEDVNDGTVYNVSGNWADNAVVTLKTGKYYVTGFSTASGDFIQDKCSLKFGETIEVNTHSSTLVLKAIYDCFLIVFIDTSIAEIVYSDGSNLNTPLYASENYYYAFVNNSLYDDSNKDKAYISGADSGNNGFTINVGNLEFEKGKYYIFKNVFDADFSYYYDLPSMEDGWASGNQHDYVDLGLSVKWATVNVGAASASEVGYRFAWGEIAHDKEWYNWDNYAWVDYTSYYDYTFTKYYSGVDNKTKLDPEDDAAHVLWGGEWRMPTYAEALELYNCTWEFSNNNGIYGFVVTGANSNTIFIPCNGQYDEGGLCRQSEVFLWTSECAGGESAYRLLSSEGVGCINDRHDGLCIRAVRE